MIPYRLPQVIFSLLLVGTGLLIACSAMILPSTDPIIYLGTTDQNMPITITVKSDFSAVTQVDLSFRATCDGETVDFTDGGYQTPSKDSFPVNDNLSFAAEAPYVFVINGTIASDFDSVAGTWQGIYALCTGFPGPCYEQCRGPVGQWSANRQP